MSSKNYFLITGMARTGTTLLDKLLFNHPQLDVLSQPLPILYRFLKRQFFQCKRIRTGYYVLNNLFLETRYNLNDLNEFLDRYVISRAQMQKVFKEMKEWSGQCTEISDLRELLVNYRDTNLINAYKYILNRLRQKDNVSTCGSKEILVEEFSEYFLNNNVKIIYLVRDPRDIFTSLNFGRGEEFAGEHRPILFHIRNWRKSVALYLRNSSNSTTLLVRYEDLVSNTAETLNSVTDFLNVSPFDKDAFADGIRGQDGKIWGGNSSTTNFKGSISSASVGNFKKYLDQQTISYIEYTCWPELKYLGYTPAVLKDPLHYSPETFREPYDIKVDDLDPSMSTQRENIESEKKRLKAITGDLSLRPDELDLYFLGKNVFDHLKMK